MRTTIEFLDALKARNGGASDYKIAKILGVTQQSVSRYRTGRDFFGSEIAIKVANLLQLDIGYVLACTHLERAKSEPERQAWQGIAALFPKSVNDGLCIMLNRIWRIRIKNKPVFCFTL